ncbi:hypothetical protein F5Y18DRAFT_436250 [Xylariaceae sp. FL1019]|nr:hypothetical protein F5Y18DRAFT_436250 [Xylariaceae sp. FL1019]
MLLTPLLVTTAKVEPADTVRVVWLSSFGLEQFAPEGRAMDLNNLDIHIPKSGVVTVLTAGKGPVMTIVVVRGGKRKLSKWRLRSEIIYTVSGPHRGLSWLLAVEYARKYSPDEVVSVAINPDNIRITLVRNQGMRLKMIVGALTYPVINGVCTQLFRCIFNGNHNQVRLEKKMADTLRTHCKSQAIISVQEGGNDSAQKFWQWNEDQVQGYLK